VLRLVLGVRVRVSVSVRVRVSVRVNDVFPFNVKKGTRGYVLDCSRGYISRY